MTLDASLHVVSDDESETTGAALLSGPTHENHIVQFYEDDAFLCETVAQFLGVGLAAGEPLIVIATPEHRAQFCDRLKQLGHDVDAACVNGQFTLLDARETLATFMVDGMPDWVRFKESVGAVITKSREGRDGRVRAYGEMVDLLWRDGNSKAAIALEEQWNDIGKIHSFSLLCAYVMNNFYKAADGTPFNEVCRTHTHVLPTESYSRLAKAGDRFRQISMLEQRARALESELAHRAKLEEALREAMADRRRAQEELQDFVENAVMGLHWVDRNGTIVWANKAEMDLLGFTRDEYVGHQITEFHADGDVIQDILSRLTRDETLQDYPARLRCRNGSIKHVLISSNVYWRDGEFVHTRCFTKDVTEQKLAEDAKRQSEKLLADALAREQKARAEAERTVRFNELFTGILGHDLRNPLSAISTGAHYLLRQNAGDKVVRTATRIVSSADRMARMVDQLLDFTRIRVGDGIALHREQVNLGDLCHRVREELETGHPERPIKVECEGELVGMWDGDRLLQVFSNLVGNALHHGVVGSDVTVRIDATDPNAVSATVHNAGAVPQDLLPVLFEPFRGNTKQQNTKGLGLGLFITQQIVLAHGGRITVQSSQAEGTTFRVWLPRAVG